MVAKMGRPKIDNPKSIQVTLRLDENLLKKLDENAEFFNESRVESLRRGIEYVNRATKKK